jgi:hypothetical protein
MKQFRKGEKEDLKIGTIYMIRYNSYKTDDECVEKEIQDYDNKIYCLHRINYIQDGRIVFGPPDSTDSYSGVNIQDTLIPIDEKIISDWELYMKYYEEEKHKTPFRGRTADEQCNRDYNVCKKVSRRIKSNGKFNNI